MGQFVSRPDTSPVPDHNSNYTVYSFTQPSFLSSILNEQRTIKNNWFEDTQRDDFESFVHRIFSHQTTDGSIHLPTEHNKIMFESLISGLLKQLDKYLAFQPAFESIDNIVDFSALNMLTLPSYYSFPDFAGPNPVSLLDFVLKIYHKFVSESPTPEQIIVFMDILDNMQQTERVYSPLLTALLPRITSIIAKDDTLGQNMRNVLIKQLNNPSMYLHSIMALMHMILQDPQLAYTLKLSQEFAHSNFELENKNITTIRARLGENAIVNAAAYHNKSSYILRNDNVLFKINTNYVKIVKIDKITGSAHIAVNENYLFIIQHPSTIAVYETHPKLNKKCCLTYSTDPSDELVAACAKDDMELFLLFKSKSSHNYHLHFINSTQIRIATLHFTRQPICMCIYDKFLQIATTKLCYSFEFDFEAFTLYPMAHDVINIPNGWNLMAITEDGYLAIKSARSHLQIAFLSKSSPISFLPKYVPLEVPEIKSNNPKDSFQILLHNLVVWLTKLMWSVVYSNKIANDDVIPIQFDDAFIPFILKIACHALKSDFLDLTTLGRLIFAVTALLIFHSPENEKLSQKILDKITKFIFAVVRNQGIIMKSDVLMAIVFLIDRMFMDLFGTNPGKLVDLAKYIASSQSNKEMFALYFPLLIKSPAIIYLIDSDIITFLLKNTSDFTVITLLQSVLAMIITEYDRCKLAALDTSRIEYSLKIVVDAMCDNFPKKIILVPFTLFLLALNSINNASLAVIFFDSILPFIKSLDKHFEPQKLVQDGVIEEDYLTEQVIETKHPVGNDNKYCWDIVFPGAAAIEVEFDESCSILIDDQDVFQILGGSSATSPIVYEKEPKSTDPFPSKLIINSASARVIFRSFAGYNLHGLKITFRRIDGPSAKGPKVIDSYQFYIAYFFHTLGRVSAAVFKDKDENPKMAICNCLLWLKKIEMPNSINKSQKQMVPDGFMEMMNTEMKAMQRIKASHDVQEIETLCVSAVLNQLDITESVLEIKKPEDSFQKLASLTGMIQNTPPIPTPPKKVVKPNIFVPNNRNTINPMMRQSLMTPKVRMHPLAMPNNNSEKINNFLKNLWKTLYQLRCRLHFVQQKAKAGKDMNPLKLQNVKEKAQYFMSVRSLFEPTQNEDSLDTLNSRAQQLMRIISADFTLKEIFDYVNDHAQYQQNQTGMISKLEKISQQTKHQHLLMQVFYPLCKRLIQLHSAIPSSASSAFQTLFERLSQQFVQSDSQPHNSFQLMTLLSNFALVGLNESQSAAVFSTIKGFIMENQSSIAWQLFIHFCMNVSSSFFEDKAKYFFESGIVGPTFLLQTLSLLDKDESNLNISFVSQFFNSKSPHFIRSTLLFLSAYFVKKGDTKEFSLQYGKNYLSTTQFLFLILQVLGLRARGEPLPILHTHAPIESHLMITSEIISFFRICLKPNSAISGLIKKTFDNLIQDYTTYVDHVTGIFMVIGEGFNSLQAQNYAITDKSSLVMKVAEYSPYKKTMILANLLDNSQTEVHTRRVIGYPRIPPNPSDYPLTQTRANQIMKMIESREKFPVLFAALSLYLNICVQTMQSFPTSLLKTMINAACSPTYEGQYHTIPDLIEAAANYQKPKNKPFSMKVINKSTIIGSKFYSEDCFLMSFTLQQPLYNETVMVGLISDDTTTEFHSFVALNIQTNKFVVNGVEMRETEVNISMTEGSTIYCKLDNHFITFSFNDKQIEPSIPFSGYRYTPILIVSNKKLKYNIDVDNNVNHIHHPSIIPIEQYEGKQFSYPTSNEMNSDSYLSFIMNGASPTNEVIEEKEINAQSQVHHPVFAKHQTMITSKKEISQYLNNITNQPMLVNSKLNTFNGKIGKTVQVMADGRVQLSFTDIELGKVTSEMFDPTILEPICFHYFKHDKTLDIFNVLGIRAIRYATLNIISQCPMICGDISDSVLKDFLAYMIPELVPLKKPLDLNARKPKCKASNFASSISCMSIIQTSVYRNSIASIMQYFVENNQNIINQLYELFVYHLKTVPSSDTPSEFNFLIETTHPIQYVRIDRTLYNEKAVAYLPICSEQFDLKIRGLLVRGSINPFLATSSSNFESPIVGSTIYLHLANNHASNKYGAKLSIVPLLMYSSDRHFQPYSWIIHFGSGLLKLAPNTKPSEELFMLLLTGRNPILKHYWFRFIWPLLANIPYLFEECQPLYHLFKTDFSILSIHTQEEAILYLSAFLRNHSDCFKEIAEKLQDKKPSLMIDSATMKNALDLADLRNLMISANKFVKSLNQKRLEFILHLFAFQHDPNVCPYFLFFNHWFAQIKDRVKFKSRTPLKDKDTYIHFHGHSTIHRIKISKKTVFTKDSQIVVNSGKNKFIFKEPTIFTVHSEDFTIHYNVPNIDGIYSFAVSIETIADEETYHSRVISQHFKNFVQQIELMNQHWLPEHDELLTPHIKCTDILSVLPATSMIKLCHFPNQLIVTRFNFIKHLNELFDGEINQLSLNDTDQPLVSLIISASSAFSSAMKLSRLEKIVCKNFNQKKSFRFNRSRALLAKTHPDNPEARSLFDQMVDQIPTSALSVLKCKDAPWRVTLEGEGATDVGGPGRDLFTELSSEICMPQNHLFVVSPRAIDDKTMNEYVPDPRCVRTERFVYVGAFVALAFVTRLQQPYKFANLVWAALAGKKITINHIYEIDPNFKQTVEAVEKGVIEDMKFTVKNVVGEVVEIASNGANIPLSVADKQRWIQLAKEYRINELSLPLKKMREGFSIFLGNLCTFMVTPDELRSFICGAVDIPIQELRQLIQTTNATPEEEKMLYSVLEEFTVEERMLFIKFATGKMSVPAPGASWNGSLNVEFVKLKPKSPPYRLPIAATCSSTVSIPRYPSKEILAEKLRTAITYGSDIVLDHAFDAGGIIE